MPKFMKTSKHVKKAAVSSAMDWIGQNVGARPIIKYLILIGVTYAPVLKLKVDSTLTQRPIVSRLGGSV